jgi:hypothetical protein
LKEIGLHGVTVCSSRTTRECSARSESDTIISISIYDGRLRERHHVERWRAAAEILLVAAAFLLEAVSSVEVFN